MTNRTFVTVSLVIPAFMLGITILPAYLAGADPVEVDARRELLANRFVAGVVLVILLFLGITSQAQSLLRSVLEERGNRMMEVILSSIDPMELLLGKLFGFAAVAATQLVLWVFTAWALSRVTGLPIIMQVLRAAGMSTIVLFVACYAVGYLLYASLYAMIGAVVGAEREAVLYQQVLSLVLVFPIAITLSLATNPDTTMAERLTWIPLIAPTLVLLRSAIGYISPADVAGSLALATLTSFALLALSARYFKGATLLSGRKLGWIEAWKASRTAGQPMPNEPV
ncbi:MAG TPA: ABC transporter permease [Gemmatimonadaceae bacterium]|nr:ABC transporter permease [Gemmatimonadaceae bacterium]